VIAVLEQKIFWIYITLQMQPKTTLLCFYILGCWLLSFSIRKIKKIKFWFYVEFRKQPNTILQCFFTYQYLGYHLWCAFVWATNRMALFQFCWFMYLCNLCKWL